MELGGFDLETAKELLWAAGKQDMAYGSNANVIDPDETENLNPMSNTNSRSFIPPETWLNRSNSGVDPKIVNFNVKGKFMKGKAET